MDALDRGIVEHLMTDGRATYAAIGADVGLSVAATKRRVDRLVADNVIQGFTAIVDPHVMGWSLEAHIQLFTNGAVSFERMRADLVGIPEVVEASTVAGAADTLLRVVADGPGELERVIGRLRALKYVQQTDTALLLSRLIRRTGSGPAPGG